MSHQECCRATGVARERGKARRVDGLPRAPSFGHSDQKNEDFSKSVCSFGPGSIFWHRSGHTLSRNAFVGPSLSEIPTEGKIFA